MPLFNPQLSKRGLYPTLDSQNGTEDFVTAMMWIWNLTDGPNDLIYIRKKQNPN